MVIAAINFTPDLGRDVDLWLFDQDKHDPLPMIACDVTVHDARAEQLAAKLDHEGFELAPTEADIEFDAQPERVRAIYYPALEEQLRKRLGARRVYAFDHDFRSSAQIVQSEHLRGAVLNAHNDYTEVSGPQRLRELLPGEADELLKRRFAYINIWKPVGRPAEDTPLAVCDRSSLASEDFIKIHLHYPHRTGQIYGLRHSPQQRWYYYPDMRTDEVLYLKCFDSDPSQVRYTAHTAFKDPTSRPDAPARQSIEVRTIAFF